MAEREALLDPTGDDTAAAETGAAPRLRSLRGKRLALVDNTKPNAALLLEMVADDLRRHHGIASAEVYTKGYFGTPVEESQIQRILANSDFAVAGIGD